THRPAFKSAEIGAQIGRATTKNNRHIDSAGNCEPAPAANLSATKFQFITTFQMRDMPGRQCPCSNLHVKFAAAPGNNSLVLKLQLQTAKRDFETGRAFIISNEQIRYTQRERIQRTAGRDAKLAKARTAKILHRRKKTSALYGCSHSDLSGGSNAPADGGEARLSILVRNKMVTPRDPSTPLRFARDDSRFIVLAI